VTVDLGQRLNEFIHLLYVSWGAGIGLHEDGRRHLTGIFDDISTGVGWLGHCLHSDLCLRGACSGNLLGIQLFLVRIHQFDSAGSF